MTNPDTCTNCGAPLRDAYTTRAGPRVCAAGVACDYVYTLRAERDSARAEVRRTQLVVQAARVQYRASPERTVYALIEALAILHDDEYREGDA